MSEGTNTDQKLYSRRDFLKMLGIGATSLVVTRLLTACEKLTTEELKLSFKEINTGDSLPLNVNGEQPRNISFQYANKDIDKVQVRQKDGVDITVPFNGEAETVRMLGEISDPTVYKIIGKNSELPSEINVGVYPTVLGNKRIIEGRQDLSSLGDLFAIKVIVSGDATRNYEMGDPPVERNKGGAYVNADWGEIDDFGQGLAVGKLDSENRFTMMGYVCDARAVNLE